jgi:hypothetical protein
MASAHFSRDYVWVVITSIASLGSIPYQKLRDLGITGIYLSAQDNLATRTKRAEVVNQGFKVGLFYPGNSQFQDGVQTARDVEAHLELFAGADNGQTAILLDFEPSDGAVPFWNAFVGEWRALRPGRVTDFTPEPFKASALPVSLLLNARFDVRVQYYFGDMSPADGGEAREDWLIGLNGVGFPKEAIRGFVGGGRGSPIPILYQGRVARRLQPGTCVWNANLLRESGLI